MTQSSTDMPHEGITNFKKLIRNASFVHKLGKEHKERYRKKREVINRTVHVVNRTG